VLKYKGSGLEKIISPPYLTSTRECLKMHEKLGMVAHVYNPKYTRGRERRLQA
jgi:hypothetical protein